MEMNPAHGSLIRIGGYVATKEVRTSGKTGKPYRVASVLWMGGNSGDLFIGEKDYEKVPEPGTECVLTFQAKAEGDGLRCQRLVDVKVITPSKRAA